MRKYQINKYKNIEKLKIKYSKLFAEVVRIKEFSMLGNETLLLMAILAKITRGSILEIGPYVGGSTAALGLGIRNRSRIRNSENIILSIEKGGAYPYPEHIIATDDIVRGFKRTISKEQLEDIVTLCIGYSNDIDIIKKVENKFNGKQISILFVDADGNLKRDLEIYGRYLKRGSILIVDDFVSENPAAILKAQEIYPIIMKLEESKQLTRIGVFPWGTYFGLVNSNNIAEFLDNYHV